MQPITLGTTDHDATLQSYSHRVAVLIPTFGNCALRAENQRTVLHWYAQRGLTTYLGTDTPSEGGFFSRARAVNFAARTAYASGCKDIYILADNDLIPSAAHLASALEHLTDHAAVTPHNQTLYTTHTGRQQLLSTGTTKYYQPKRIGSMSYVVIRASAFAQINGMDEHFEGWGPEDQAFIASLRHQIAEPLRLEGSRLHLWHPHDRSKQNRQQLERNRARFHQYLHGDTATATVLAREYGDWLERDQ
jgi:hypothetical protein